MPEAFPECNPTRSAPARALDIIYQNTTAKSILVIVSIVSITTAVVSGVVQVFIGPTPALGVFVAQIGVPAGLVSAFDFCASFLVPSGWFYSVTVPIAPNNVLLSCWEEVQF